MTERSPRTDFVDLIRRRRAEARLSLQAVADRATDPETGTQVKASWLHRVERGLPVNVPQLPLLRALATGLDLPLGQLQEAAAAQFLGLESVWSPSTESRDMLEVLGRLSPGQRSALLRFVEAFVPRGAE